MTSFFFSSVPTSLPLLTAMTEKSSVRWSHAASLFLGAFGLVVEPLMGRRASRKAARIYQGVHASLKLGAGLKSLPTKAKDP